jgi:hypothetical protein
MCLSRRFQHKRYGNQHKSYGILVVWKLSAIASEGGFETFVYGRGTTNSTLRNWQG